MSLRNTFKRVSDAGDRPVPMGLRRRVAAGAVAVILIVGAILIALSPPSTPSPRVVAPHPSALPKPIPAPTIAAPPVASPPTVAVHVSQRDLRATRNAARRFLAGYLPFTYGHGSAQHILAATHALRDALTHGRPRVPPTVRHRRTRIRHLEAETASASEAVVVALISDGARIYAVAVAMERIDGHWLATGLRAG